MQQKTKQFPVFKKINKGSIVFPEPILSELKANPNIMYVNNAGYIYYSRPFKEHFVKEYLEGKSAITIFREAGLSPEVLGTKRIERAKERWLEAYKSKFGDIPIKKRGFEPVSYAEKNTLLPIRGTSNSAGYDFFAPCDITIPANSFSDIIFFNIKAYMPQNEYLGIVIRSSLATKKGKLMVSQGEAIIDSDYYNNPDNEGNIGIMFWNRDNKAITIKKGERCCQGIFKKYYKVDNDKPLNMVRKGGYGSTGSTNNK